MKNFRQIKALVAGLLLSSSVVPVVVADDIEIYKGGSAETANVNPNVLFIVDNSGSMSVTSEVRDYYVKGNNYTGGCERDGIYFVPLGGGKPDCSTSPANYFNRSALVCDYALTVYDAAGVKSSPAVDIGLNLFGTYSDQFARQDDSIKNSPRWEKLPDTITASAHRDYIVECLSDSGLHGDGGGNDFYITDNENDGYTTTVPTNLKVPHPVWAGGGGHMTLYDGNYLNYLTDPGVGTITPSRLDQVKRAVEIMVATNNRINIGLMALDQSYPYEGGAIRYPMEDIVASRNNFANALGTLDADAETTLSETYYEALLYYGGKSIDYGDGASPVMTGEAKDTGPGRDNTTYKSPISSSCGVNYIVVLSDGTPTADNPNTALNATTDRFDLLPGMSKTICNTEPTFGVDDWNNYFDDNLDPGDPASVVDNCLDDLAEWAQTNDVAQDATLSEHNGDQHIVTHTIGFALDAGADADAITLLQASAKKGAGDFYSADNGDQLTSIFEDIISNALKLHTTFSSPAVSVNVFNRSTHLDDLYFTLFKPHASNNSWEGNLKKYKIKFSTNTNTGVVTPFIADKNNSPAVDAATGFFAETATSYWSTEVDGKFVQKGGAAAALPAARNVYTITGMMDDTDANGVYEPSEGNLSLAANEVVETNTDLTDALLGITGKTSILDDALFVAIPYRTTLINWAAGKDVFNDYGAEDTTTDARLNMGDPLHAEPALVQYGLTPGGDPDLVAYVATNDGYLHAFDVNTGIEEFSFIPQDLLTELPAVMENNGGDKTYGLDGSVVAWVYDKPDANGDTNNIIRSSEGDHVYLYISMRRGGRNIYALDVTDRSSPELLWEIKGGNGDYTELGETWSTVNVEKIKDGAVEKTVLVFGGGYDATQDNAVVRRVDTVGRTVYIADATSGARLWSGGADGTSPNADMLYSIPARIKPLDISGDGYIDRLYAVDMGGQIFRFDIDNTNNATLASSISGGRIADLAGSAAADARRFYYPPDVALIDASAEKYHALVISSGYRAHPLNETIHDRIYMIKDRNTALLTSNADYKYDPISPATVGSLMEGNLEDVTTNLAGGEGLSGTDETVKEGELARIANAEGWYIDLDDEDNPGTWVGEKGLAEPLIIEGVAIVTTFTPTDPAIDSCSVSIGLGKVFFLDILDATPAFPSNIDVRRDRHIKLVRSGIPPSPNGLITKGGVPTLCVGTECQAADFGLGVRKTYWYEVE